MAIGVAALHVVNCLTGRCGGPGLLISPCIDNTGAAGRDLNPSDNKMAAGSKTLRFRQSLIYAAKEAELLRCFAAKLQQRGFGSSGISQLV
jgi:hypothetical protein